MVDRRGEFRRFWESNTGFVLASLMALAAVGNLYGHIRTSPDNFPDLDSRFRIQRGVDSDGVYRLSVLRADRTPVSPFDDDLVALERKITAECGSLAKSIGQPDINGSIPVNFRLYHPGSDCSYLQDN